MKETEKIEIMHFSQEGYVEDGKNVYEAGKKMTALADKVAASITPTQTDTAPAPTETDKDREIAELKKQIAQLKALADKE